MLEIVLKKVCNLPIKVYDDLIWLESDLSGLEIDNIDGECLFSNWLSLMTNLINVELSLFDNYIDNVGFEWLVDSLK